MYFTKNINENAACLIIFFAEVRYGANHIVRYDVRHHFAGLCVGLGSGAGASGSCCGGFLRHRHQLEDEVDEGEDGEGVHDGGEGGGVRRGVGGQAGPRGRQR